MAKLHIVRASAGSGKTFRLTLQYLSYLFTDSDNFRHILAVTFTNKAAEEMKSRIIHVLHQLAKGEETDYLEQLKKITGLEEKNIRLKADVILKKILHKYSYFSVETIDTFFQKVIRSFTREMGIQNGFSIELDEVPLLVKAIDDLFDTVTDDELLRNWILKFAESRIEESRGWNLKKEIYNLSREIFKEKYKEKSEALSKKIHDKDFMNTYIGDLYKIIHSFENKLSGLGKTAVSEMEKHGATPDDFYYTKKGPAGYLNKLATGQITPPNVYVKNTILNPDKWVSAGKNALKKFSGEILHPLLEEAVSYYVTHYLMYNTSRIILSNIYTLGILSDITSQVRELIRERNLFLLSDSAEFINKVIDNNDAPFIYEKTGNYFKQYLIDEFQDTSGFQWKNFKPLISNSLSQNYDCLVVGDVKQSVYRWRNSNWEIMADEVSKDFYSDAICHETLETNRRSSSNVINFNNNLFTILPSLLGNQLKTKNDEADGLETIHKLFFDVVQKIPEKTKEEGFVNIRFYEASYDENPVFKYLIETLNNLQDAGYRPKDIAILTRGKKEGKEIADFLINHKQNQEDGSPYCYNVISDDSLFIGSSISVRFIISVLKFFISPDDDINNYYLLVEYFAFINNNEGESHALLPGFDHKNQVETMKAVLPNDFFELEESKQSYSLPELVQKIILLFKLNKMEGELGYLMALKDIVMDYTSRYSSNISSFLEYWTETGCEKSIPGSDSQDAIRILTIHKSKGLEFDAVIIPFCDWKIEHYGSILWCEPAMEPFNKLEVLPVAYNKSLADTIFAKDYYTEKIKAYIDNLNLLYVALTRAKKSLFCFSVFSNDKAENNSIVSQFIYKTISEGDEGSFFKNHFNPEKKEFLLGELGTKPMTEVENTGVQIIHEIPESDIAKNLKIAYHAKEYLNTEDVTFLPLNYGKLMHELFSQIQTLKDVAPSIEKMYLYGKINSHEKEFLSVEVNSLFMDIQVNSWFSGDWKPINERDILQKSNNIKRPDRVLIKGKNAMVIDFKFGNKETPDHKKQVLEYKKLLSEIGYEKTEGYLWYISKRKVVMVNEE